jgi:hypothetical protein
MGSTNVRSLDPDRTCEADARLTAIVFEQLACAIAPSPIMARRHEHMRRIVVSNSRHADRPIPGRKTNLEK